MERGEISSRIASLGVKILTGFVQAADTAGREEKMHCVARPEGFEPPTPRFVVWHSNPAELQARCKYQATE